MTGKCFRGNPHKCGGTSCGAHLATRGIGPFAFRSGPRSWADLLRLFCAIGISASSLCSFNSPEAYPKASGLAVVPATWFASYYHVR